MSITPGTIVVGIDDSEASAHALEWAVAQALAQRQELTLAHAAAPVVPTYGDRSMADPPHAFDDLEQEGRDVLRRAHDRVASIAPGLVVDQAFRIDDPRQMLLDLSRTAALLVVGSRGRGSMRSLLLGSVSVALTRHAHCPVLVHRPTQPETERRGIAVAADASADSLPVLEFAYRQAELFDRPLVVVHCAWDAIALHAAGQGALDALEPELAEERRFLDGVMSTLAGKYPGVRATTRMLWGAPADEMARLGDHMDLLVVGAHQRGRWHQTLFGSVSVSLVEHARTPVAVVPIGGQD